MTKRAPNSIFLICFSLVLHAQISDTLILNESKFLKQVLGFAPAIKNAGLKVNIQNQELLYAKGAFEPKILGQYSLKKLEGKSYFDKQQTGFNIKTPFGIKLAGGLLENQGDFLNPENNVPTSGLIYTGVELPLGAGMFTDKDRTNIKQQRLKNDVALLIQVLSINEYLFEAGENFWDWYESIALMKISEDALIMASDRLEFVKSQNQIGEAAIVDTLEAYINYQNRLALNISNLVNYQKMSNSIKNYIWLPNRSRSLLFPEVDLNYLGAFPDSLLKVDLARTHPLIRVLETDSIVNQASMILNREFFKPELDLTLRLQEDAQFFGQFDYEPKSNHYLGIDLRMPLFLRKQRAKSKQLNFKKDVISNKKKEALVKIENTQTAYFLNAEELKNNVFIWQSAVQNYKVLLQAEQTKLRQGESSLFIVNSRELKWIEAREMYVKNYVFYRKALLGYYHSLAMLPALLK